MASIKVVAFIATNNAPRPILQVSADGASFSDLNVQRGERRLPSPPGGASRGEHRTLVEYEATVPTGQRFLKIRWNGPAELDRVEIEHAGSEYP